MAAVGIFFPVVQSLGTLDRGHGYRTLALISAASLCLTQNALALIFLLPALRFAVQVYLPCEQVLKTKLTGSAGRAVALSAYNMAANIAGISLEPLLGVGTNMALRYGHYAGFGILAVAAAVTLVIWKRISGQVHTC